MQDLVEGSVQFAEFAELADPRGNGDESIPCDCQAYEMLH
jgi:hypothetical protein